MSLDLKTPNVAASRVTNDKLFQAEGPEKENPAAPYLFRMLGHVRVVAAFLADLRREVIAFRDSRTTSSLMYAGDRE